MNRRMIDDNELDVHDARIFSIEKSLIDGMFLYTLKANKEEETEDFIFNFSGVTSCLFTGENHIRVLGESINSWYSLPSYPYDGLPASFLTKDELEELNQHGIYKNDNIRKNIRILEQDQNTYVGKPGILFKVVFFFSLPAFLEIECENMRVEKVPRSIRKT